MTCKRGLSARLVEASRLAPPPLYVASCNDHAGGAVLARSAGRAAGADVNVGEIGGFDRATVGGIQLRQARAQPAPWCRSKADVDKAGPEGCGTCAWMAAQDGRIVTLHLLVPGQGGRKSEGRGRQRLHARVRGGSPRPATPRRCMQALAEASKADMDKGRASVWTAGQCSR